MGEIPLTYSQRWDELAVRVADGRGEWVLVYEAKPGANVRTDRIRRTLERRGLRVEVESRAGNGSEDRPWFGWRTWARTL